MKHVLAAAVLLAATTFIWMLEAPGASAATVCDEPNGMEINADVAGSVTVPANGVCHLNGHAIGGSVSVGDNAKLFVRTGTVISGSITATGSQQLNIENGSQVKGGVSASGPGGGFGGFICGAKIGGTVALQNLTSGSWIIGEPTVAYADDPVPVYGGPDPDLTCTAPNFITGGVKLVNNNVARLKVKANTIGSGVSVVNNTVVNEIIRIEGNTISGSLGCSGNDWTGGGPPEVTGGLAGNTVSGSRTGQCN